MEIICRTIVAPRAVHVVKTRLSRSSEAKARINAEMQAAFRKAQDCFAVGGRWVPLTVVTVEAVVGPILAGSLA